MHCLLLSASDAAHLGLVAVGYRREGNDVALGVHEAGVVFFSVQEVKVPVGQTAGVGTTVKTRSR